MGRPDAALKMTLMEIVRAAARERVKSLTIADFIAILTERGLDERLERVCARMTTEKTRNEKVEGEVLASEHPHALIHNHLFDLSKPGHKYLKRRKIMGKDRSYRYSKGERFRLYWQKRGSKRVTGHRIAKVRGDLDRGLGVWIDGTDVGGHPSLDDFVTELRRVLSFTMWDDWKSTYLYSKRDEMKRLSDELDRKFRESGIKSPKVPIDIQYHKDGGWRTFDDSYYQGLRYKAQHLPSTDRGTQRLLKRIYNFIPDVTVVVNLRQFVPEVQPSDENQFETEESQ